MKIHEQLEKRIRGSGIVKLLVLYFIIIILFAGSYFLLSMVSEEGIYSQDQKIKNDISGAVDSLYFSFVTSTSLGYGDITPRGISRGLAVVEVLVSLVIFGIIVSKLLSRNQEKILEELYEVSFQERFTRIISGLYDFRAEIDRITSQIDKLRKHNEEELIQSIESNLHLLSSYIIDSEKVLSEIKKRSKDLPLFKGDIILNNMHSSIAKLEELASVLNEKNIHWKRKAVLDNIALILNSTQKVCVDCISPDHANINETLNEVKKHSDRLKGAM